MPRETNAAKRERAIEVCERLNRRYGPVECFLDHENPFRLLIAVLLSAQTTDAQVNKVTPRLFAQWPTPEAMAGASVADVADTIKSLGFYKSKAKHAVEAAQMIVADYIKSFFAEIFCKLRISVNILNHPVTQLQDCLYLSFRFPFNCMNLCISIFGWKVKFIFHLSLYLSSNFIYSR